MTDFSLPQPATWHHKLGRLPSLDGWRAVSIGLVMGAHSAVADGFPPSLGSLFYWLFDGDLGVRCFLVISGFLITWLLLREFEATATVSLRQFYVRRSLRILPVYFGFIVCLAAISLATKYDQPLYVWLANLTFTTDFLHVVPRPSAHLWSLSVEEQFYFLWPSIFVLTFRGTGSRATKLLLIPLAVAPLWRVASYLARNQGNHLLAQYSFFNYFDSLAMGCLCACSLWRSGDLLRIAADRRWTLLGVAITCIGVPYVLSKKFLLATVMVPFGDSLQAFGIAVLILQSIAIPTHHPYALLNTGPMRLVGIASYSLYIWQQIFCTSARVYGLPNVWWLSFPGWIVPACVATAASYLFIERPFHRLRAKYRVIHDPEQKSRQSSNPVVIAPAA